ncbi:hypothetical protein [Trichormus variabilis]|nr:hypothetical protein [Trichormus variabilis]
MTIYEQSYIPNNKKAIARYSQSSKKSDTYGKLPLTLSIAAK